MSNAQPATPIHVGLVGAGIGGVTAAIGLARYGAKVTVLEAAAELGEIGAGIQMTPNVAKLLIEWGIADVIGDNLVEFEELNLRRKDGTPVGYAKMETRAQLGWPWWLVHRMHLHDGLVTVAKKHGVELITGSRVSDIDYTSSNTVKVRTQAGRSHEFDLLVGSDGINSVVRRTLFPNVKPEPPTGNCAYRAIVPWEMVKNDPITSSLAQRMTMEVWMGAAPSKGEEHGYIISYPISGGKDFNMVLSHFRDHKVYEVEDATLDELKETYKHYDPRIKRVIEMIPENNIRRWPLMVTQCPSWSNAQKNVVLMGDAAHSMVNHMAQGAATSMEDGCFLAVVIGEVVAGRMTLAAAVDLYESERRPLADKKQQLSYLNGAIWHLEDGSPEQVARDKAMEPELAGKQLVRSPNLYADPYTTLTCYGYDPEGHAKECVAAFHNGGLSRDPKTHVTDQQADIFMNWFNPRKAGMLARL